MQKVLDVCIQYVYNHFITPTTELDSTDDLESVRLRAGSGCRADPVMDENGRLSVNLGDV